MTGLRHLFALRDAVLERNESLKTVRSLDLWMQVLNERSAGGPVDAAAARILNSFLVTQSQSAACERTFATVEELKILGLTLTFSVRMLPNPFRTLSFCGVVIPDLLQIEKKLFEENVFALSPEETPRRGSLSNLAGTAFDLLDRTSAPR